MTDRLEALPESGARVPEIDLPGYRQIRYGSHRVVYRINPGVVAIVTIRRSRQLLRPSELE